MFKKKHLIKCYLLGPFLALVLFLSCKEQNEPVKQFSKKTLNQTLIDINGNQVRFDSILKQNQGKPILIEVWASWCGDCIAAMPKVKEIALKHPNIHYIYISMDKTPEQWKTGINKHSIAGKHYLAKDQMKGVFGKSIDLNWIPRYMLLNKKGEMIIYNAIETDLDLIDQKISDLKLN